MSITTEQERAAFSQRLALALGQAEMLPCTSARLANEFNQVHSGSPITLHAARKWLIGEAIPTQEKLKVLAAWLGVSAVWLRYGDDVEATPLKKSTRVDEKTQRDLNEKVSRLNRHHRQVVMGMVDFLLKLQQKQSGV
jgi:transcriptional regulator with XRE-family HTH domain